MSTNAALKGPLFHGSVSVLADIGNVRITGRNFWTHLRIMWGVFSSTALWKSGPFEGRVLREKEAPLGPVVVFLREWGGRMLWVCRKDETERCVNSGVYVQAVRKRCNANTR